MSKKRSLDEIFKIVRNPEISIYASQQTSIQCSNFLPKKERKIFLKISSLLIDEKLNHQKTIISSKNIFILNSDEIEIITDICFLLNYKKKIEHIFWIFFAFNSFLIEENYITDYDLSQFYLQFQKIEQSLKYCKEKIGFLSIV